MVIIASGSLNPAKVEAVRSAAIIYYTNFKIIPVSVDSGVSNMPTSKSETRMGAKNRAINALIKTKANLSIAHEGGICNIHGENYLFSACVATNGKEFSWGGETIIRLPKFIIHELKSGEVELGDIIEKYSGIKNARTHTGATAFLTNNFINRVDIFTLHSVMALSYFANGMST